MYLTKLLQWTGDCRQKVSWKWSNGVHRKEFLMECNSAFFLFQFKYFCFNATSAWSYLSFRLYANMKKCICRIFTRISGEGFHFFCWLRKFRLGSSVQFENENSYWISRQYPRIWCWLWIPFLTHDTFFYSGFLFWPHVGKIDMANLTRNIVAKVDLSTYDAFISRS